MRIAALIIVAIATSLVLAACGGPDDDRALLAEACERQIEETHVDEAGVPVAESTEERLDAEQLVGCAGQASDEAELGAAGETQVERPDELEGEPTVSGELDADARATFASSCGGCHTLEDANTSGTVGPDLSDGGYDVEFVRSAITEGPGAMPENLLEGQEADDVAAYVAAASGGGEAGEDDAAAAEDEEQG